MEKMNLINNLRAEVAEIKNSRLWRFLQAVNFGVILLCFVAEGAAYCAGSIHAGHWLDDAEYVKFGNQILSWVAAHVWRFGFRMV